MFHVKQSIKLIILICILTMCGVYPVHAEDNYTLNSVYFIEDYSGNNTLQIPMPQETIYPHMSSSAVNQTIVLTSTTTYQLTEQIRYEDSLYNTYLTPTALQGAQTGYITSFSQRITYTNTSSDTFQASLHIIESRGGSGSVTIYFQKNGEWVQGPVDNFENTYNSGDLITETEITGWRFDIRYNLTNRFAILLPNSYQNGFKLNSFGLTITSSADEQAQTLNDIKDNTSHTNSLLGTIKNAIDSVVSKVEDVIDAIADLPDTILQGLKDLFIPTDFAGTLQDGVDEILESMGVIGYPITFIRELYTTIRDTSATSMVVDIPALYYKGHVIFPNYHKGNIFYFTNIKVFDNVQKTSWLVSYFSDIGLDASNVTIGQCVQTFMHIWLFIALIGMLIRFYNNIFGTDVGEVDEDDN